MVREDRVLRDSSNGDAAMKAWFVPPLVVPLFLLAIIVIYGIFRSHA